ncbi:uncharacterized protein [Palaemon carinicauda]|uniref:uncharacterized protein n=1 Tax=Palaemon carinicauda TaxID=392227 RepID=UPI0035B6945D
MTSIARLQPAADGSPHEVSLPESHPTNLSVPLKFVAALLVASVMADKVPITNPRLATILKNKQHTPGRVQKPQQQLRDRERNRGSHLGIPGKVRRRQCDWLMEVRYVQDDGTIASLKFVADENGYQPESDLLPVAPHFPHPMP